MTENRYERDLHKMLENNYYIICVCQSPRAGKLCYFHWFIKQMILSVVPVKIVMNDQSW